MACIVLPLSAHAESVTNWSFLGGQVGPDWRINGQARSTAEMGGLHISAESDVSVFRETKIDHSVDAVEITYLALQSMEAALIWHLPGTPPNDVVQLPIALKGSAVPTTKKVDAGWYEQWTRHPDLLGLRVPKGADIQIIQIRLVGWSPLEKIWHALQSYWTFDAMSPYSVNFLWGPVITHSPIARSALFTDLPPHGTYINVVWYVLLLLAGAIAVLWTKVQPSSKRTAVKAFALILAVIWALSDLRMGSEIVSYALHDIASTDVADSRDERFRERANFRAFLKEAAPLVADRGRYVFLTQYPYPFLGLMRYHTHPALPVPPEQAAEGLDTWVVFARGDMSINEQGQLMSEGKVISPPGDVLLEFSPDSFVFRSR